MSFKLPCLKPSTATGTLRSILGADVPLFTWSELSEKEDPIGQGTFGSVFVAKRGDRDDQKVVVKKILSKDNYEQRLFLKEARILIGIEHRHVVRMKAACVDPCAIMLEYLYFDFAPFGASEKVSSLEDFLLFTESSGILEQFSFQQKIALDSSRGLAHLYHLGIVHRDIKPATILVSNAHYRDLSENAIQELFRVEPITCKLADFGESRSAANQTARLCRMATTNKARGTPVYRAPELFLSGSALSIEDLKAADIWALGMVFHVLLNPDLKYPYQIELRSVTPSNCLKELENMI